MEQLNMYVGCTPTDFLVLRTIIEKYDSFKHENVTLYATPDPKNFPETYHIVYYSVNGVLKISRSYTKHFDKDGYFNCTLIDERTLKPGLSHRKLVNGCEITLLGCHEHDDCDPDCDKYCDCPEYPKEYRLQISPCADDKDFYELTIEENFI